MSKKVGHKDDHEKSRFDLLDPLFLLDVADVLTFGAAKYGDYNWIELKRQRYIAASYRHLNAMHRGEYLDKDTGKPHAACLACNAMFLHYLDKE